MRTWCLILFACVVAGDPAAAQEPRTYQDWIRQCGEGGQFVDHCIIRQRTTLRDSGRLLFEIAAGFRAGESLPLLRLTGPLRMYLPDGIRIRVDGTESYRAVVDYCDEGGCHAYYRMTEKLFQRFRNGRWLNVALSDASRRELVFRVSLNGFTAAIESVR